MRLWHLKLLRYIPDKQLLGQHRECCALRGRGFKRFQSTVEYAQHEPIEKLVAYHYHVMNEMERRNFNVTGDWWRIEYRGQYMPEDLSINVKIVSYWIEQENVYDYHDDKYLRECIQNLEGKGVDMSFAKRSLL